MHLSRPVIFASGILVLLFGLSLAFFPVLPETLATHWNAAGVADGYMPRLWGLFLVPVLALILAPFFFLLPRIDPLYRNIQEFRNTYEWFIAGILTFLLYVQLIILVWNLGFRFDLIRALSPALAALWFGVGTLVGRAKRNWFIGIRTPWTLSSDRVWARTHERGALLFRVAGIIALAGIILPGLALFFILIPAFSAAIYLVVYSYVEFRRAEEEGPARDPKSEHIGP